MGRRVLIATGALVLSGCISLRPDVVARCGKLPAIRTTNGVSSTDVRVLTYNVEGLPWPARSGRTRYLEAIGQRLALDRRSGSEADVVLLQEAFSNAAARAVLTAGYPNRVSGPSLKSRRYAPSSEAPATLVDRRKVRRGEGLGPVLGSGLWILSDYPVIAGTGRAFRRGECAGSDCLAKKGVQWARVQIPGVPAGLDLFNTHLQSRSASGVSRNRSLAAHRLQVNELSQFIRTYRGPGNALIFGGDFNMRHSARRFKQFDLKQPWPLVHRYCTDARNACRVLASWDGDAPWMDTQDLQGFSSGSFVQVRPIQVETRFDQPWQGSRYSDHDGLLVTYRLSWPASPSGREGCGSLSLRAAASRLG